MGTSKRNTTSAAPKALSAKDVAAFLDSGYVPFRKAQCVGRIFIVLLSGTGLCLIRERSLLWAVPVGLLCLLITAAFIVLMVRFGSLRISRYLCDGIFGLLHCGNYEFGRVPMHRIAGRVKRSEAHCDDGSAAYMGRGICGNHRFMDQSRKILKHEPIKAKFLAAGSVRSCRHGACQSLPAGPIPTDGLCGYHRGSANTVTCDGHDGFVSAESMVLREAHGRVNYHTAASRS